MARPLVVVLIALAACARSVDRPRSPGPPPVFFVDENGHRARPQQTWAPPTAAAPPIAAPPPPPAPAGLPPIRSADDDVEPLVVSGHGEAYVSLPDGAVGPRPVVVAVHGMRSRPDWQCRSARHVFGARAFAVCPQGIALPAQAGDEETRFGWGDARAVAEEIDAALAALARAYPGYVDAASPVYYGHSSGAYLAVNLMAASPGRWTRMILHEGGFGFGAPANAAAMRVLFACGTPECHAGSAASVHALTAAGGAAREVYSPESGHHGYGPILDLMAGSLDWLLAGDPRF